MSEEENKKIRLSIITPVLNGAQYIEECIQNVCDQATPEIEHIIVDGASTDGTVDIIKDYARRYGHIRWISENDSGLSEAINKGVKIARGEFLGVLNADDYYDSNCLKKVIDLMIDLQEPAFLVGNCSVFNDQGELRELRKARKLNLSDLLLGYQINPMPINPSSYFYHKSLHNKVGLYSEDIVDFIDWDFILRAVQVAHNVYVDENFGNYRLIKGTKTMRLMARGEHDEIACKMLKRFQEELPYYKRILVMAKRCYFYQIRFYLIPRLKYYLSHISEILPMVKRKIAKALNH